jgi:hypothetical protein
MKAHVPWPPPPRGPNPNGKPLGLIVVELESGRLPSGWEKIAQEWRTTMDDIHYSPPERFMRIVYDPTDIPPPGILGETDE